MENAYVTQLFDRLAASSCDVGGQVAGYTSFMEKMVDRFYALHGTRHQVFFVGNGGSAGISMHMNTDFLKNGRLQTHSMHDPATLTCLANDYGYDEVFSRQLALAGAEGDLLVAISSSGRSENILRAARLMRELGGTVMTFTGFAPDNPLRQLGDYNFYVPSDSYGIVESIHQLVLQQAVDELMQRYTD
ncbi:SIS domain-containing protein [Selenomonas sp.]|uniref:SIS domain-containing protein n=1 Tax=Selenomonas sp. TaxID=2053611 RepID=UPI002A757170|nr:SIS domain-containing protein [Selenomonas sp.]MDY3298099.1 SIS domain-containing protein [Selenomonas sp.]